MLDLFERLAREGGDAIMDVRARGFTARIKGDDSPVTEADRRAEAIILHGLRAAHPDLPIVAEEEASEGLSLERAGKRFILVDPLDGTREFVSGGEDFTVNIALVDGGRPVAGVVFVPATGTLYAGDASGASKDGRPIRCIEGERPRIVASKSHRTAETDEWIACVETRQGACEIVSIGSSLKFCLLAEGAADLYPRFGRTMEWDTAAGDAVLRAAGGMTWHRDGDRLEYGKPADWNGNGDVAYANPHFVAGASEAALRRAMDPHGAAPPDPVGPRSGQAVVTIQRNQSMAAASLTKPR